MTDDTPGIAPSPLIDIRAGAPTAEELAAVVAVVSEEYEAEAAQALAQTQRRPSAWQVSARGLREPIRRELGWRAFPS